MREKIKKISKSRQILFVYTEEGLRDLMKVALRAVCFMSRGQILFGQTFF